MPRSKDPTRYPKSYFDALLLAQRNGKHEIACGSKPTAESLRLNFSTLRTGIIENKFPPFHHFAHAYKFLIRLDPPRLIITWGGNDDLSLLVEKSINLHEAPSAHIASYAAEHAARDAQLPQESSLGARFETADEEEILRRVRERLGMPEPSPEERVRTADEILADFLNPKKDPK